MNTITTLDWALVLGSVAVVLLAFLGSRWYYWNEYRKRRGIVNRTDEQELIAEGNIRYSPFFGSRVEMVQYTRDDSYVFRVLEGPRAGVVFKNESPWSALPLTWRPGSDYQSPRPGGGYVAYDYQKKAL